MSVKAPARACGIDFGTSNSTAGWLRPDQPPLLALEGSKTTLPSVIFFNADENTVSVGQAALDEYLDGYEGRLMRALKSLLGSSLMEGKTEIKGRSLLYKDLLAQFIAELKRRTEKSAGRTFDQAVFGRPVFFVDDDSESDQKAEATLQAIARACGFKEVSFQYEPIAAAYHYERQIDREELVLIADIGGGTSDFSLIRLSPQRALLADRRDDLRHTLTRLEFEQAATQLVEKIGDTLSELLANAGVSCDAVDTVFFTGGASGVPMLRERIAALLPKAQRMEGDMFGSIGAGLAVEAQRRYG